MDLGYMCVFCKKNFVVYHDQGNDQGHDHDQGHDQGHDHDQGRGVPVPGPGPALDHDLDHGSWPSS